MKTKFVDIYDNDELRRLYAQMYPKCSFDEDCFFVFVNVGGRVLLIDGSLSIAIDNPGAESFPFYSAKGEKRVRAAMAACKNKKREFIDSNKPQEIPKSDPRYPITIGITPGPKITEH